MNRFPNSLAYLGLALVVMAIATSAQAAELVVMSIATHSTNVNIPIADQLVTFGVQVPLADLPFAGTQPVLFVQNIAFLGNGTSGPIQASLGNSAPGGTMDVQSLQTNYLNQVGTAPPTDGQLAIVSVSALPQTYADSWWYNANGITPGVLYGYESDGLTLGAVTAPGATIGATPNSGTNAVGSTGYTFQAESEIVGGTTNHSTMAYTGLFGPIGANSLTGAPLAGHYVGGSLTVPLAQILTSGNIYIPGSTNNSGAGYTLSGNTPISGRGGGEGTGTFIQVAGIGATSGPIGDGTYNVNGGNPRIDPGLFYSFSAQQLQVAPEPSSLLLAALGGLALLAWRGCRHSPCEFAVPLASQGDESSLLGVTD